LCCSTRQQKSKKAPLRIEPDREMALDQWLWMTITAAGRKAIAE
jgi:hypothetical protein